MSLRGVGLDSTQWLVRCVRAEGGGPGGAAAEGRREGPWAERVGGPPLTPFTAEKDGKPIRTGTEEGVTIAQGQGICQEGSQGHLQMEGGHGPSPPRLFLS